MIPCYSAGNEPDDSPEVSGVTRDELARIALRYDTAMSRAMLRALGLPVRGRAPIGRIVAVDSLTAWVYDGIAECMGQRYGVAL